MIYEGRAIILYRSRGAEEGEAPKHNSRVTRARRSCANKGETTEGMGYLAILTPASLGSSNMFWTSKMKDLSY